MPNSQTFKIAPIADVINRHIQHPSIDPFANNSKIASITNDIIPDYDTDYTMDAIDFLKSIDSQSVNTVLFDPPYSPRQVSEVYKKVCASVNMETTQASFWAKLKKEISRVVAVGGKCITFGWNSGGIGSAAFNIVEIKLVAHGGWHNDTIVTVEQKIQSDLF